jgi:hypothetical protein
MVSSSGEAVDEARKLEVIYAAFERWIGPSVSA